VIPAGAYPHRHHVPERPLRSGDRRVLAAVVGVTHVEQGRRLARRRAGDDKLSVPFPERKVGGGIIRGPSGRRGPVRGPHRTLVSAPGLQLVELRRQSRREALFRRAGFGRRRPAFTVDVVLLKNMKKKISHTNSLNGRFRYSR